MINIWALFKEKKITQDILKDLPYALPSKNYPPLLPTQRIDYLFFQVALKVLHYIP